MPIAHRVSLLPLREQSAAASHLPPVSAVVRSWDGRPSAPERLAEATANLTRGTRKNWREVLRGSVSRDSYGGSVLVRDVEFCSLCQQHLLPFYGRAHIAYLPDGRLLEPSTLPRLLDVFARRRQLQERLTSEVAAAIQDALAPRGVAVMIDAVHLCARLRGVSKQRPRTTTVVYLGAYRRDASLRGEFLAAVLGPLAVPVVADAPQGRPTDHARARGEGRAAPAPVRRIGRRPDYTHGRLWQRHRALTTRG